jgi:hypothetical protein
LIVALWITEMARTFIPLINAIHRVNCGLPNIESAMPFTAVAERTTYRLAEYRSDVAKA